MRSILENQFTTKINRTEYFYQLVTYRQYISDIKLQMSKIHVTVERNSVTFLKKGCTAVSPKTVSVTRYSLPVGLSDLDLNTGPLNGPRVGRVQVILAY